LVFNVFEIPFKVWPNWIGSRLLDQPKISAQEIHKIVLQDKTVGVEDIFGF